MRTLVGVSFLSPLSVVLLIDRRAFDVMVVEATTSPADVQAFVSAPKQDKARLRVAVVVLIDTLSAPVRSALSKVDRLVVIDTPSALEDAGVRNVTAAKGGSGAWTMIKMGVEQWTSLLSASQDVASDLSSMKQTASRDFMLLETISEELGESGLVLSAARAVCGLESKKTFDEAAKAALVGGDDPRMVQRLKEAVSLVHKNKSSRYVIGLPGNVSTGQAAEALGVPHTVARNVVWAERLLRGIDPGVVIDVKVPRGVKRTIASLSAVSDSAPKHRRRVSESAKKVVRLAVECFCRLARK